MRVLKFGGMTLADPSKIKSVAQKIARHVKNGEQIIAVVSAMGKTTNDLIHLAKQVSASPSRREMDMLLSVGERISMSLLSMALNDLDIPALSFTGSQAGIITTDDHENAQIIAVKPIRIAEALNAGKTIIVAGFQGVSQNTKEITTLGRGGSDTTAVALACHFKCDCEILKELSSVYTADPKIFPSAQALHSLSYAQLLEMTFWGAQMLNHKACQMANENKINLFIGSAADDAAKGTLISAENRESTMTTVQSFSMIMKLSYRSDLDSKAVSDFFEKLHMPYPHVLFQQIVGKKTEMYFTDHAEYLDLLSNNQIKHSEIMVEQTTYASVTVASCSEKIEKLLHLAKEVQFPFVCKIESRISIAWILQQNQLKQALNEMIKLLNT